MTRAPIAVGTADIDALMRGLGEAALAAQPVLARAPRAQKDAALRAAAGALRGRRAALLEANAADMTAARAKG
ncbi:MAG: gamma-glutamyl-phosphate reductase, partial [Gammaproteobacteria bacterium]